MGQWIRTIGTLIGACAAAVLQAAPPQAIPPPDYAQIGKPDPAEGRKVLEQFRQSGLPHPYYLEFELRRLPRRGPEKRDSGRLWGIRTEDGPALRIEMDSGSGGHRRFLIQNGPKGRVWISAAGVAAQNPRPADPFEPLLPGTEVTVFDLQMPFLYWPDWTLAGLNRIRGRPAHQFLFRPPSGYPKGTPEFSVVRAFLDTQYRAPVQVELIDGGGRVLKTLALVDLQKVGDQWLPKTIEVRNESTRDKTRFALTAADLDAPVSAIQFTPDFLDSPLPPPPPERLVRLSP